MQTLGRSQDKRYVYALMLAICAYAVVFSVATCWKHYAFNSFAWDLGTFDQILHDSVFEGHPFYYTFDLFMNPSGHYFAIHFSPILVLFFPLYRLFPVPQLLLVVKSVAVGAAAYPLYLTTRRLTGNTRTGVLLGVAYLLNPCIKGANWFDFQPQSLLPLLVFSAYYLLESGSIRLYLLTIVLTLCVEEHSSVIVLIMLGVFLIGNGLRGLPQKFGYRKIRVVTLLTVALSPASAQLSESPNILWYPRNDMTPSEVYGVHAMIADVPADASILTQNHLFPHLSGRLNAYALPVTPFGDTQLPAVEEYLKILMARSEYIFLDLNDGNTLTPIAVRLVEADTGYKPVDSVGDVALYRRTP